MIFTVEMVRYRRSPMGKGFGGLGSQGFKICTFLVRVGCRLISAILLNPRLFPLDGHKSWWKKQECQRAVCGEREIWCGGLLPSTQWQRATFGIPKLKYGCYVDSKEKAMVDCSLQPNGTEPFLTVRFLSKFIPTIKTFQNQS